METEQELLGAIRSGDRSALRRLYDRYSGYAMAIGLRYVPRREEVRDVIQDSFVKILTSIGSFEYRGEGSLKSWVSRIVANKSVDYLRQHERFMFVSNIPDEVDEEPPDIQKVPPEILTEMIGQLPAFTSNTLTRKSPYSSASGRIHPTHISIGLRRCWQE